MTLDFIFLIRDTFARKVVNQKVQFRKIMIIYFNPNGTFFAIEINVCSNKIKVEGLYFALLPTQHMYTPPHTMFYELLSVCNGSVKMKQRYMRKVVEKPPKTCAYMRSFTTQLIRR